MATVQVGFRAFDPHELLCHVVALEAGLYDRERLQIELVDITFTLDTDLPHDMFQVSCGAALISALNGIPQRVIFVVTDRPLFWLYASHNTGNLQDLKHKRLATFPVSAPPYNLVNIVLRRTGIDTGRDIILLPVRDDVARFGLLKTGDIDAALISSALSPVTLERAGFHELCFLGDMIRVPTTGLAIHETHLRKNAELVATLAGTLRDALALVHHDSTFVGKVLHRYFDVPLDIAARMAALYARCFTRNGQTTPEIAQAAIGELCSSLRISKAISWRDIYDFSLLEGR